MVNRKNENKKKKNHLQKNKIKFQSKIEAVRIDLVEGGRMFTNFFFSFPFFHYTFFDVV